MCGIWLALCKVIDSKCVPLVGAFVHACKCNGRHLVGYKEDLALFNVILSPLHERLGHKLLTLILTKSMWRRLRGKINWVCTFHNLIIVSPTCIHLLSLNFLNNTLVWRKRKYWVPLHIMVWYVKNMAHVMANVSTPTPPCRSAMIAHTSYIDDEVVECVDLDD